MQKTVVKQNMKRFEIDEYFLGTDRNVLVPHPLAVNISVKWILRLKVSPTEKDKFISS